MAPKTHLSNFFNNTYIGLNCSALVFLVKIRWFGVMVMVLLSEVVIVLYVKITLGCLLRNASTSLYSASIPGKISFRKSDKSYAASAVKISKLEIYGGPVVS